MYEILFSNEELKQMGETEGAGNKTRNSKPRLSQQNCALPPVLGVFMVSSVYLSVCALQLSSVKSVFGSVWMRY